MEFINRLRRRPKETPAEVEPTDDEQFGAAIVKTGFGRGGLGSFLWPDDDEGFAPGDYDRYFDAIQAAMADRLDAPADMLLKAKFDHGDDVRLVSLCLELGDFELHAPCNNSVRVLNALRVEREETLKSIAIFDEGGYLDEEQGLEYGPLYEPPPQIKMSDPMWQVYHNIIIVDCPEAREEARRQVEFLWNRERMLRQDVNRAKAGGWFVDYSFLSDHLMQQYDPVRRNNSAKLAQFPYHYRLLHGLCVQSPGGIYLVHEEAVLARMMTGMTINDHMAIRKIQSSNRSGGRSGGQGGGFDRDEQ